MEIIKLIGVGFVTAIGTALLKNTKPELSFAVSITGIIVMLLIIVDALSGTISTFTSIAQLTGMNNGLLKIVLKIIGVGYVTEFSAGLLNDFGSAAVADKVLLGGKITIIVMSLPIIEYLFSILQNFLKII